MVIAESVLLPINFFPFINLISHLLAKYIQLCLSASKRMAHSDRDGIKKSTLLGSSDLLLTGGLTLSFTSSGLFGRCVHLSVCQLLVIFSKWG